MADDIDKLRKLLALALHANTPEEEARTAAMQACKLIEDHEIQMGGQRVTMPQPKKWSAPDTDVWNDIMDTVHKQQRAQGEQQEEGPAGPDGVKPFETDYDIDDDFMRKRITIAWQAIRDERRNLEYFIDLMNKEKHVHYPKPNWGKK